MSPTALIAAFAQAEGLGEAFPRRAAALQLPLATRIGEAAETRGETLTVGLCGPQGSGKSTSVALLRTLLEGRGLRTATLSIDDLYLSRARRRRLATEVHPLLLTRGPPGTHDVAQGIEVLGRLAGPGPTRLPRFDKGRDEPLPREQQPVFDGPADVILFEGWCVGARPQGSAALVQPVNALERERDPDGVWRAYVDDALAADYQTLFGAISLLIQLRAPSFETVLRWRRQQEQALRERLARSGGDLRSTLTDDQVAVFVQHYERLTRHIDAEMPARADVLVTLGEDRQALSLGSHAQAMAESTPPSVSTS